MSWVLLNPPNHNDVPAEQQGTLCVIAFKQILGAQLSYMKKFLLRYNAFSPQAGTLGLVEYALWLTEKGKTKIQFTKALNGIQVLPRSRYI